MHYSADRVTFSIDSAADGMVSASVRVRYSGGERVTSFGMDAGRAKAMAGLLMLAADEATRGEKRT